MIAVISYPVKFPKEAEIINRLFDAGLEVFHLRKFDYSKKEMECLIQNINTNYRERLAAHNHHDLAIEMNLKRLHFTEQYRLSTEEITVKLLKNTASLTTSVHSVEGYNKLKPHFEYVFLSPVFDSISKPGYCAAHFDLSNKKGNSHIKLLALGGVNQTNCTTALKRGYDGIALMGSIWNSNNKIETFKTIKK